MTEGRAPRPSGPVWQVGELIAAVADHVRREFPACTVSGEISGFSRAASGHCYFTLKDPAGGAAIRCAFFRRAAALCDFLPAEGDAVELRGRLDVYEPRGEMQFIVEAMRRSGAGALYERFLRLRAALEREGLFEPTLKRPLPVHPVSVGVVTSLGGAVLHDVATTLARRSPHVRVVVYPSVVQGPEAPAALCEAIRLASERNEVEVLIVCRGGGSLEDLWAFNDERVVRAVRGAAMPVVSAVGHETDVTLADLAADLRAPTPTAAAELVALAASAGRQQLEALQVALSRRLMAGLESRAQRVDRLALRLARPAETVRRRQQALDGLGHRLVSASRGAFRERASAGEATARRRQQAIALELGRMTGRLGNLGVRLFAVDPARVLGRGFALLTDGQGRPVSSVRGVVAGQEITARLHDGRVLLDAKAVLAGGA